MVGNRRKFKESDRLSINRDGEVLNIQWEDREANTIQFSSKERSIAEWIELLGEIPLPPYLNREVEERDKLDYQAVFARNKGAVAAPTASLHFTTELIARLNDAGIEWAEATLHVGAGTFKPVTVDFVDEHEMHAEQFEINLILLDVLLNRSGGVVALGTTACRVLESLPILGAKIILGEADSLFVSSEDGYRADILAISTGEALHALREYIMSEGGVIRGETQIFMIPGFDFRLTSAMITNFHQPKSTLMLLVSAFVGGDWKEIYEAALAKDYRFLSYGDGSLLRGKKKITW
jgi:S-adenosylmethionine:tRNA ribosyltransferase-isomerase